MLPATCPWHTITPFWSDSVVASGTVSTMWSTFCVSSEVVLSDYGPTRSALQSFGAGDVGATTFAIAGASGARPRDRRSLGALASGAAWGPRGTPEVAAVASNSGASLEEASTTFLPNKSS